MTYFISKIAHIKRQQLSRCVFKRQRFGSTAVYEVRQLTAIQTKSIFTENVMPDSIAAPLDCRSIMHEILWNKYIAHVSQRKKAKTKSFAVNERIPEIVSLARAFCENTKRVEMVFFSSFSFPSTQPNFMPTCIRILARAAASDGIVRRKSFSFQEFVSRNFSPFINRFVFIEMKIGAARLSYCEIEDNK